MVELGVAITAATVTILVAEFLRCRRRPLPGYGWLGLVALAGAEWLMFRGVEPAATYFTPMAWSAYLLLADAAVLAITGRSRLHDAPQEFARTALLSIPLWLIFEGYNLRLANWTYVGVPLGWLAAGLGYAWSFATIFPAIFETAVLVESFGWFSPARKVAVSRAAERAFMGIGAIFLVVPLLIAPRIASCLFALVWLGFLFLLDPINHRMGLASFTDDFEHGRRSRLYSLLISGWVCGWLWEFWNYWAAAKWHYIFPIFPRGRIFEMPVLGYLGFPPFAAECFVMYTFADCLLRILWRLHWKVSR